MPKEEQRRALWTDEVLGFLQQSNISAKNIKRLRAIEAAEIESVSALAALVRKIAQVKPHKKRRWKWLRANHRELIQEARKLGLLTETTHAQPIDPWDDINAEFDWAAAETPTFPEGDYWTPLGRDTAEMSSEPLMDADERWWYR